jgi:uncharacterized Ntn-hydrolase superfamily protein
LTFSVVALDLASGTTGAAIASCVPLATLERVYGAVPERGALITQSYLHDPAQGVGLALLEQGASASEVIASLTDPGFDPDFELRQYAVIDGTSQTASFTGAGAKAHASHLSGRSARFVHLVQGNFLTGAEVLQRSSAGFASADACDLADALVRGLVAGGEAGGGDARCIPHGQPAQSALVIVGPVDAPLLEIAIDGADPPSADPLALVAEEYAIWRAKNPCSEPRTAEPDPSCSISAGVWDGHWVLFAAALAALCVRVRSAT